MTTETSPERLTYKEEVLDLANKYLDLVAQARTLRSPRMEMLFNVTRRPPTESRLRTKMETRAPGRLYWRLIAPLIWSQQTNQADDLSARLSGVSFAISAGLLLSIAAVTLFVTPVVNAARSGVFIMTTNIQDIAFLLVYVFIVAILAIPVSQRLWGIFGNTVTWARAGYWVILLGAASIFVVYIWSVLASANMAWPSIQAIYSVYTSGFLGIVLGLFEIVVMLMLLMYIASSWADAVIWLIWRFGTILNYVGFYHSPMPTQDIQRLTLEPISPKRKDGPGKAWLLSEVSMSQIEKLKQWAEANRETTGNRILPTILTLSILQFFGWKIFQDFGLSIFNLLTAWYTSWATYPIVQGLILALISLVGLAIGGPIVRALANLFVNQLAQNLVVEACILAGYAKEQSAEPLPQPVQVIQYTQAIQPSTSQGCLWTLRDMLIGRKGFK